MQNIQRLYNEIEDDFQQGIEADIDEILGEDIPSSQREELIDSISLIFSQLTKNYLDEQKFRSNNNSMLPINFNNTNPSINIYLLRAPPNPFLSPPYGYYQPQMNANIPPNPYQMQMIQSQQLFQPPNPYNYNQPQITSPTPSLPEKKSKSSSKKKKDKSKSKSEKHHSKSEKHDKKQKKKSKKAKIKSKLFKYNIEANNAFKGIIDYLTQKSGGNVSRQGVVIVTGSSQFDDNFAENAVDLENRDSFFEALNQSHANEWIKYDFKEMRVKPTFYSIRANNNHGGEDNLRNWVVEGSNDDITWKVLDSRNDDSFLSYENAVHTYKIEMNLGKDESFRYLRVRSTGKDSSDDYIFSLSALEYFGHLYE